ncbi:MAG TPA: hypothetical protein VGD37_34285 [Kofleriaceae bacterium]
MGPPGHLEACADVCFDQIIQPDELLLQRARDTVLSNDRIRQISPVEAYELNVCPWKKPQRIVGEHQGPYDGGFPIRCDHPERSELLYQFSMILFQNLGCHGVRKILFAKPVEIEVRELGTGNCLHIEW